MPNDPVRREIIYRTLFQLMIATYVPLWLAGTNGLIIAIALFWLTEPHLVQKLKASFKNKLFLSVAGIFLIQVAGLIHSSDLQEGLKQVEVRLSLLAFPLILSTIQLGRRTFVLILKTFVWVCMATGVIGLLHSTQLFLHTGNTVYLYSDNLLLLFHGQAIYFALYLNLAVVVVVYLNSQNELGKLKPVYLLAAIPFFVVMIFLLASRVSIALLVLLAAIIGGILIIRRKKFILGATVLVAFVAGFVMMAVFFPKTVNRFKSLTYIHFEYDNPTEVYHFNEEAFVNRWNGLTVRLAIWSCVWEGIRENPVIGTGIGDYRAELRECYTEKNFVLGLRHNYSPHNQYLQIALSLGAAGLIFFLVSLFYPAFRAFRYDNQLYLVFLLLLGLNMLTEDILGTFRGVVFFSFFNSLLLFQGPQSGKPS